MKILSVNAHSSSLKGSLVEFDDVRAIESRLAKSATSYRYRPNTREPPEKVFWKGPATAR